MSHIKPSGTEDTPAWVKALNDRLDRLEASRTAENRKQQLGKVIDRLPENLRKAYERLPLDGYSDEQFSTVLGEPERTQPKAEFSGSRQSPMETTTSRR